MMTASAAAYRATVLTALLNRLNRPLKCLSHASVESNCYTILETHLETD